MAVTMHAQAGAPARHGPALTTLVRLERTRTVVVLKGEADPSTRSVLCDVMARVIGSRAGDVVVDLEQLRFIDSGSVRVFALTQECLDRQDRKLIFRSPSTLATRVLHKWGLAALIESQEVAQR